MQNLIEPDGALYFFLAPYDRENSLGIYIKLVETEKNFILVRTESLKYKSC